jgi:MOSC domain-containing protein YiiM
MATVTAVCVVHALRPGHYHDTAIDKRPQRGRVEVRPAGLAGDTQVDPSHGGRDAAVYVYADEDAAHFAVELGEVPAGYFGENLRTRGLDVTGARLGERWRMGDVLLEVRKPRTPCRNLEQRVGREGFHLDFHATGRVGALCRVLEPGTVAAGDDVVVEFLPDHPVSIGMIVRGAGAEDARRLLDSGVPLAPAVRAKARRIVARAERGGG